MQALPEVTPRKEPTEITGSLFAVAVVIPLNYPRANQCSRTIGERPHSGRFPGCQEEIGGTIAAYDRHVPHRAKPRPKPTRRQPKTQPEKQKCYRTHQECSSISKKLIMRATP